LGTYSLGNFLTDDTDPDVRRQVEMVQSLQTQRDLQSINAGLMPDPQVSNFQQRLFSLNRETTRQATADLRTPLSASEQRLQPPMTVTTPERQEGGMRDLQPIATTAPDTRTTPAPASTESAQGTDFARLPYDEKYQPSAARTASTTLTTPVTPMWKNPLYVFAMMGGPQAAQHVRQRWEREQMGPVIAEFSDKFTKAIKAGDTEGQQSLLSSLSQYAPRSPEAFQVYKDAAKQLRDSETNQASKQDIFDSLVNSDKLTDKSQRDFAQNMVNKRGITAAQMQTWYKDVLPSYQVTDTSIITTRPGGGPPTITPRQQFLSDKDLSPEEAQAIEIRGGLGAKNKFVTDFNNQFNPNADIADAAKWRTQKNREKYNDLLSDIVKRKIVPFDELVRSGQQTRDQVLYPATGGAPGGQPGGIPPAGQPTAPGAPGSPNANVSYAPRAGTTPGQQGTPEYVQQYGMGYEPAIMKASQATGIRPELLRSLMAHESAGDPNASGNAHEIGLFQLTPATAQNWVEGGVKNARNNDANIMGGAQYLKMLLDRFGGNEELAVAAYNAGPEAVIKAGYKVPQNNITPKHVRNVLSGAGAPQGQTQTPQTTAPPASMAGPGAPPATQTQPTQTRPTQYETPAASYAPGLVQLQSDPPGILRDPRGGPPVRIPQAPPDTMTNPAERAAWTSTEQARFIKEREAQSNYFTVPEAQGRVSWWRDAQGNLQTKEGLTQAQNNGVVDYQGATHPRYVTAMANQNDQFLTSVNKITAAADKVQRFLHTYGMPGQDSLGKAVWDSISDALSKGLIIPLGATGREFTLHLPTSINLEARNEFNAAMNGFVQEVEAFNNQANKANIDTAIVKRSLSGIGASYDSINNTINQVRRYANDQADSILKSSNAIAPRQQGTESQGPVQREPLPPVPEEVSNAAEARAAVERARRNASNAAERTRGEADAKTLRQTERGQAPEWFSGPQPDVPPRPVDLGRTPTLSTPPGHRPDWAVQPPVVPPRAQPPAGPSTAPAGELFPPPEVTPGRPSLAMPPAPGQTPRQPTTPGAAFAPPPPAQPRIRIQKTPGRQSRAASAWTPVAAADTGVGDFRDWA